VFCSFLDQVEINRFFAKKIKKIKVQDCAKSASKTMKNIKNISMAWHGLAMAFACYLSWSASLGGPYTYTGKRTYVLTDVQPA
jgi:hypothetical protein